VTIVRAAGGIVWRRGPSGIHIVLVHRADRGEWAFPKGKLDAGEDEPTAALREVREETGLVPALGADLGTVVYRDARGRPKIVRYYAMRMRRDDDPRPAHEIDDARWFALERSGSVLTHDHDRRLLERFAPTGA
jgi:8-oxo-dGTP pyrophosphatase MutT (NUDIX family)